jgi:hypothetical protein
MDQAKSILSRKEGESYLDENPQIFNPGGSGWARVVAVVLRHVSHEF